jgi:hypothetical protein
VYQVEQNVRDTAVRRQAIGRLSSQFRADAHGADTVRLRTEDVQTRPRLEFKNPDGSTIEYYQRDDEVIRTVRQADTVLHTDGFRFGRWSAVTWAVDDGQPPTASADLTRRSRRGIQVNGEYRQRIEAVVGLHASLLSGD